jgi:hypothetical protein
VNSDQLLSDGLSKEKLFVIISLWTQNDGHPDSAPLWSSIRMQSVQNVPVNSKTNLVQKTDWFFAAAQKAEEEITKKS